MNSKQHITPQRTVRFRRWSRKGYAVFASLGLCVTIGQLRKNITERALSKQTEPGVASSTEQPQTDRDLGDEPFQATPTTAIERLLTALSPQIAATQPAPYGPHLYSINRGIGALNASCHFTPSIRRESRSCKTHSMRLYLYSPTSYEHRRD